MRGVEGQIVGIVQLVHGWDLRKLNKQSVANSHLGEKGMMVLKEQWAVGRN